MKWLREGAFQCADTTLIISYYQYRHSNERELVFPWKYWGVPMKYHKNRLGEQLEGKKPVNIFDIFKSYIKSSNTCWLANFPMKKCVLSHGHKKYVQRKNRVSNGNCANNAINTVKYIVRQNFRFLKRPKFPTPLYNILGALDTSNLQTKNPQTFL